LNRIIQRLNAESSSINVDTTAGQTTQINTESANFRAEMRDCLYKASDVIQRATGRTFVPYQATFTLPYQEYRAWLCYDDTLSARVLRLPDDLLSVATFTFTGATLTTSDYYTRPANWFPIREVAIYGDVSLTYPSANTDTISLAAIWGYHPGPDNMWQDSGATVSDNPFSASAVTLNVSSSANLQVLQYIRIEDEYLLITAISSNALTVQRGVRGTTAAAHIQTTGIDTFVPIEDIADECARLAIRRYRLRAAIEVVATGETAFELQMGDVQLGNHYRRDSAWTV
jgi:hypothetical protein